MKNLKKLTREQLRTVSGGDDYGKYLGDANCHCHGCKPNDNLPNGLPPSDTTATSPSDCWVKCDRYRSQCEI